LTLRSYGDAGVTKLLTLGSSNFLRIGFTKLKTLLHV